MMESAQHEMKCFLVFIIELQDYALIKLHSEIRGCNRIIIILNFHD
jgi:hypothetical protein